MLPALLAQTAPAFRPFITPLPVYDYWYTLLVPLCLCISIIYKSIKCREMKQVPREATVIFIMILLGMATAAVALIGLMKFMQKT